VKHDSKEITLVGERNFVLPHIGSFKISTPESTNDFRNVHLPHHPPSLYFPMSISSLYEISGGRLPGVCAAHRISSTRMYVSTFDNVVFNVTPATCRDGVELNILLAADCSSSSKFAVSVNYQTTTKQWEVRVATAAHTAVIRPLAKTGIPDLYVDNVRVVDEKYEVKAADGSSGVQAKNSFGSVSAMFDVGVMVKYMPDNGILVGLSPLYSGLTCGICGDYNGQRLDEFTLADGSLTEDSDAFHRSYVAGLQQCS
jgi:hypothetical protein